ncbi:MAG: subclass B3 metallo-beta-lactamase [Pyrinomonadaceae bacterium]
MKLLSLLFILAFTVTQIFAQVSETDRSWNQPVEPFRIAGNVYYVGANEITSYLITTPKGHIVLDGGFKETVPQIAANIVKLGFKVEDVKYLLNSQAHYDHAAGLADLKSLTRAKLLASVEDAKLLARGGKDDPNFGDRYLFEPAIADKTFADGWKLKLGGATMTANITPGHTPGCTTWTTTANEAGKDLNVIFVCSTTAPGYKLVGNEKYPNIASDFENTFKRLRGQKVDIFLSAHAGQFRMDEKLSAMRGGAKTNPFIDPKGYLEFVDATEKAFRDRLASQSVKP